jgi:hypothetical protein
MLNLCLITTEHSELSEAKLCNVQSGVGTNWREISEAKWFSLV